MTMPETFVAESDRQRREEIAELLRRASELADKTSDEYALAFSTEPLPLGEKENALWPLVVKVVVDLDDRRECTPENLWRIVLRPLCREDGHGPGVWCIEVSFGTGGLWSGKEWCVTAGELFDAWHKHGASR